MQRLRSSVTVYWCLSPDFHHLWRLSLKLQATVAGE